MRRLGLHADAQLQHGQHVAHGDDVLGADADAGHRTLDDEGADPVAGLDPAGRLQVRNGFAHHGAAHAMHFHDRRLGGQLVAGLEAALGDLADDVFDHALGQGAVFFTRQGGRIGGGGRSHA
jgi:hypothetical protein